MKSVPYSFDEFKPHDFHLAQRVGVLESALRQVIEVAGAHAPAMQASLGKIIQQMDQGAEIAHEIASTSTLVSYGSNVMRALFQDQHYGAGINRLMHELGILPKVRQSASPMALSSSLFYQLMDDYCHEEPKSTEEEPAVSLDLWYQRLVRGGYAGRQAQRVKNASIFHPNNAVENAILISLSYEMALVILLDQPRVQFLHIHRGRGAHVTLIASSFSNLQSQYDNCTVDEAIDSVKQEILTSYFANMPQVLSAYCGVIDDGVDRRQCLAALLEEMGGYTTDEPAVPTSTVDDQACTIRRGAHDQIGAYTSFVHEKGEVIFRDETPSVAYFATGSQERPELLEVPFEQLSAVSLFILIEGLTKALYVMEERHPESEDTKVES